MVGIYCNYAGTSAKDDCSMIQKLNVKRCYKPIIAAVHSHCIGAGIDLITACDIRLAAKDAVFSIKVDLIIMDKRKSQWYWLRKWTLDWLQMWEHSLESRKWSEMIPSQEN